MALKSLSPLGKSVAAQVKNFILTNAASVAESNVTVSDGADALAQAIGFGIAKALGDPTFLAAIAAGAGPAAGGLQVTAITPLVAPDVAQVIPTPIIK